MALTNERKLELLEQFLLTDIWNDFLLPEYKEASEILHIQLKSCKDPHEAFKLIGQTIGLDALIYLPNLKAILQQQVAQAKEQPPASLAGRPEPPSAETV